MQINKPHEIAPNIKQVICFDDLKQKIQMLVIKRNSALTPLDIEYLVSHMTSDELNYLSYAIALEEQYRLTGQNKVL